MNAMDVEQPTPSAQASGAYTAIAYHNGQVKVSDSQTRKVLAKLRHPECVLGCWIDPTNSKIATTSMKSYTAYGTAAVHIWNLETCEKICTIDKEFYWHVVTFSSDGSRLITLADDKETMIVWNIDTVPTEVFRARDAEVGGALTMCFRSDCNRIIYSYDFAYLRALDATTGNEALKFGRGDEVFNLISWHGGRPECISFSNSYLTVWNFLTGNEVNRFKTAANEVQEIIFGVSENQVIGAHGEHVSIWDVCSGTLLLSFSAAQRVSSFALNTVNNTVILLNSYDPSIVVHDAGTGKLLGSNKSNKIMPCRITCTPASIVLL
jgi:WD40 repeat protein